LHKEAEETNILKKKVNINSIFVILNEYFL